MTTHDEDADGDDETGGESGADSDGTDVHARSARPRKRRKERHVPPSGRPPRQGRRWSSYELGLGLAAGVLVGLPLGFAWIRSGGPSAEVSVDVQGAETASAAPNPTAAAPAAGNTGNKDNFGRSPGDEHFGHNHPPKPAAPPAAPAPAKKGEKDGFGRSPGEEHYGHDHQ